MLVQFLNKWIY